MKEPGNEPKRKANIFLTEVLTVIGVRMESEIHMDVWMYGWMDGWMYVWID